MPDSYIIFICSFDPFGLGIARYDIERTCLQKPDMNFDCGSHWIALNAQGARTAQSDALRSLLQYVQDGTVNESSLLVRMINERVESANDDRDWMEKAMGFMTAEENWEIQLEIEREEAEKAKQIAIQEALQEAERVKKLAIQDALEEAEKIRKKAAEQAEAEGRAEGKAEGIAQGKAEGIAKGKAEAMAELERFKKLTDSLIKQKRFDDLQRASVESEYAQKLFEELQL